MRNKLSAMCCSLNSPYDKKRSVKESIAIPRNFIIAGRLLILVKSWICILFGLIFDILAENQFCWWFDACTSNEESSTNRHI